MTYTDTDRIMMRLALGEAEIAGKRGEVPVGAVVTRAGAVVARAGNRTIEQNDPSAHAEILAIRIAAQMLGNHRLTDCDLYVTLEPCAMCAGAISIARMKRVVFAASDEKGGAVENGVRFFDAATCHHRPDVARGPFRSESAEMLKSFFRERR